MCLLDGSIVRYKARTAAPGFSQQYGLEYDKTFSPVEKITIVQVPPALVVNKDWKRSTEQLKKVQWLKLLTKDLH